MNKRGSVQGTIHTVHQLWEMCRQVVSVRKRLNKYSLLQAHRKIQHRSQPLLFFPQKDTQQDEPQGTLLVTDLHTVVLLRAHRDLYVD